MTTLQAIELVYSMLSAQGAGCTSSGATTNPHILLLGGDRKAIKLFAGT
jgi:hypothetical protein